MPHCGKSEKNPNILLPDDTVVNPDMKLKEYNGTTEERHIFQLRADKVKLELRLLRNDQPRVNTRFRLKIGNDVIDSQTDDEGWLRTPISATVETAKLVLQPEDSNEEEYELLIGHLDPLEEDSGVLKRLHNLGFLIGSSGNQTEERKNALANFQRKNELPRTDDADQTTREKLKQMHGS